MLTCNIIIILKVVLLSYVIITKYNPRRIKKNDPQLIICPIYFVEISKPK